MIIHLGISLTACVHAVYCYYFLQQRIDIDCYWSRHENITRLNQHFLLFEQESIVLCVSTNKTIRIRTLTMHNMYTDSKNDDDRKKTHLFLIDRERECAMSQCILFVFSSLSSVINCRRSRNSCGRFRITIQSTELPHSTESFLGRFNQQCEYE